MPYQDKKEKMKELTDKMEQGIKDIFDSEHFRNYLTVMAKFHSYSYRNSLLILLQKPEATHVAGFNAWKNNFKRFVNKGEKGIQILAPTPYRIKMDIEKIDPKTQKPILDSKGYPITEEVEITKPAFRPVYVFDVSQTAGEPLPQLTTELTGNIEQYNIFFESLKDISPFPIQFEDIQGGAKGYCNPSDQKIAIKEGMSQIQNIKTAIHEITHADLHSQDSRLSLDEKKDRRTKEVEAESVAFVVCNHFNIDTSDYSFLYLAAWSSNKELKELHNSLETIQKQAAELIDRIDTRFQELLKEQPLIPLNNIVSNEFTKGYQDFIQDDRTFTIYQLKTIEDNHHRRFLSYAALEKQGEQPNIENYEKIYSAKMDQLATLENIYQEFNINHPEDFKGHSLSMSDIIAIESRGAYSAYYIDTFGFVSCPDFAIQHQQRLENEISDSVKFDNDIDLDREKTREQLGFKDSEKPLTIVERMESAKQTAKGRVKTAKKNKTIDREER